MATADKLNKVLQTKEEIRVALEAKGLEVATSTPFEEYSLKIAEIPAGGGGPDYGPPATWDDQTGSPGPKKLIGGDMTTGYFGKVSSEEFFTASEISTLCEVSVGQLHYNNLDWFKFALDGKIIFKSQQAARINRPTDNFHRKAPEFNRLSYKGRIEKDGVLYQHRFLKVMGPSYVPVGEWDEHTSHPGVSSTDLLGSEFHRLMLPLSTRVKADWGNNPGIPDYVEKWASMSDPELGMNYNGAVPGQAQIVDENGRYRKYNTYDQAEYTMAVGGNGSFTNVQIVTTSWDGYFMTAGLLGWYPVFEVVV